MTRKIYRMTVMTVCVCCLLSGCSLFKKKEIEAAYSMKERGQFLEIKEEAVFGLGDPFASSLCVVAENEASTEDDVAAAAAAVFSIEDRSVLYNKQVFERLYPASITKVMTALLVIKYGNLSDQVIVPSESVITEPGATLAHINPGDVLTLEQLLYGLMLPSGNDAGNAIAVHMGKTLDGFAAMMNEEARALGATGTHFMNAHGLSDDDHYTTAYDLYLIFNEALKYPVFQEVTKTVAYTANYTDGAGTPVSKTWNGSNLFMLGTRQTPAGLHVFSGKTGTTKAAGYCLIMASQDSSNKKYISIILKAGSRPELYDNMTKIISKIVE